MRRFVIAIGLWLVLSTLVWSCAADAHEEAIIECTNNIIYKYVRKMNETRLENGLLDEHYDSDADFVADIHVLSSIRGAADDDGLTPHDPNPVFWVVDKDFDGKEDAIYIDIHGEGKCDDIKLCKDLNKPELNPEAPNTDDKRQT